MDIPAEVIRDQKRANIEDKETLELFQMLLRHPGWQRYVAMLNKLIEERSKQLLEPTPDTRLALSVEHNKGAMYGLIYARDLTSITVATLTQQFKSEPASEETSE